MNTDTRRVAPKQTWLGDAQISRIGGFSAGLLTKSFENDFNEQKK